MEVTLGPCTPPPYMQKIMAKQGGSVLFAILGSSCKSIKLSQNTVRLRLHCSASTSAETTFCEKTRTFSQGFVVALWYEGAVLCAGVVRIASFCFSTPRKGLFSRNYACLLYILPRPSWSLRLPGVFKSFLGAHFL